MSEIAFAYMLGALMFLIIIERGAAAGSQWFVPEDRYFRIGCWFGVFCWPLFILWILFRRRAND